MSGHKISIGKNVKIKDGKLIITSVYRDASAAIRAKKSKKVRVKPRGAF